MEENIVHETVRDEPKKISAKTQKLSQVISLQYSIGSSCEFSSRTGSFLCSRFLLVCSTATVAKPQLNKPLVKGHSQLNKLLPSCTEIEHLYPRYLCSIEIQIVTPSVSCFDFFSFLSWWLMCRPRTRYMRRGRSSYCERPCGMQSQE